MLPLPSIGILVHTLYLCIQQRSLPPHSFRLHSCVFKRGLDTHTSLGNKLVFLLAEFGYICCAQKVFDSLDYRNESCWASLIDGSIKCGNSAHAVALYQKMHYESPCLDAYTFVSLLKACAGSKDVKTGGIIHSHVAKLRLLENNAYVSTALVDMYAKCGALAEAQEVFDSLAIRNIVTWNALIAGYVRHERFKEAVNLFDDMQTQGVFPDSVTFACALKACASLGATHKGLEIHDKIDRMGLVQENQFVGNTLVNMYSKCGLHAKAKDVFEMLPVRSVTAWNALIAGYMHHNRAEEVLSCLEQMQLEGVPPDDVTYACSLKACGNIAARDKGREIHGDIKRKGSLEQNLVVGTALVDMYAKCGMLYEAHEVFNKLPAHDVIAWSALIAGYTQHKHGEEALNCFDLMRCQGTSPNATTYACSLKACGMLGAIEKGRSIHDDIEKEGLLKTDQIVGNALVDMYAKCGSLSKAWQVFEQLPVKNVISWTAIITGYAQLGKPVNVLTLLERMRGEGVNPNRVTFLSVLNACSHAGLVDSGQTFFEAMTRHFGITPALQHQTCVIDLLSRAGQVDKATEMMTRTPSHIDAVTCLALLGACKKWHNVKLGKHAFDFVLQLDERDTAAYVCMGNIYADAAL